MSFQQRRIRVPLGIRLRRDALRPIPARNGSGVDPVSALSLSRNRGGEKDHVTNREIAVTQSHATAPAHDLAARPLTPDPNPKGNAKAVHARNGQN